jgi:hypothetical protein
MDLTELEWAELVSMIEDWVSAGFTTPPYSSAAYGVFEKLGITGKIGSYDTTRPTHLIGQGRVS